MATAVSSRTGGREEGRKEEERKGRRKEGREKGRKEGRKMEQVSVGYRGRGLVVELRKWAGLRRWAEFE